MVDAMVPMAVAVVDHESCICRAKYGSLLFFWSIDLFLINLFETQDNTSQCVLEKKQRKPVWGPCGSFFSERKNPALSFGADYSSLRVSYSNLRNALLYKSVFSEAEISNSSLSNFDVLSGNFSKAQFIGNSISGSFFSGSDFSEAEFFGNLVENSRFVDAIFYKADFHGSRFVNCDFKGADFRSADLRDTTFLLSQLKNAKFDKHTQLPFSRETAQSMGMVYLE